MGNPAVEIYGSTEENLALQEQQAKDLLEQLSILPWVQLAITALLGTLGVLASFLLVDGGILKPFGLAVIAILAAYWGTRFFFIAHKQKKLFRELDRHLSQSYPAITGFVMENRLPGASAYNAYRRDAFNRWVALSFPD